jgi:hypothetical protein
MKLGPLEIPWKQRSAAILAANGAGEMPALQRM